MRLTLRLLSGEVEDLEAPDAIDIDGLKRHLHERGLVPFSEENQKVVHSGRLLTSGVLQDLGISDGDSLVVLEKRAEPPPSQPGPQVPAITTADVNRAIAAERAAAGLPHMEEDGPQSEEEEEEDDDGITGPLGDMAPIEDILAVILGDHTAAAGPHPAPDSALPGFLQLLLSEPSSAAAAAAAVQRGEPPAAQGNLGLQPGQASSGLVLPEPDPEAVSQLVEMGFPESRVRKALLLTWNNVEPAAEWLVTQAGDPTVDNPLTQTQLQALSLLYSRPRHGHAGNNTGDRANGAVPTRVVHQVVADPDLVSGLIEMGFTAEEAERALELTNNDQQAACSWLLGDRDISHFTYPPAAPLVVPLARLMERRVGTAQPDAAPQAAVADGAGAGAGSGPTGSSRSSSNDTPVLNRLRRLVEEHAETHPQIVQAVQEIVIDPSALGRLVNDPEVGPILREALLRSNVVSGNNSSL